MAWKFSLLLILMVHFIPQSSWSVSRKEWIPQIFTTVNMAWKFAFMLWKSKFTGHDNEINSTLTVKSTSLLLVWRVAHFYNIFTTSYCLHLQCSFEMPQPLKDFLHIAFIGILIHPRKNTFIFFSWWVCIWNVAFNKHFKDSDCHRFQPSMIMIYCSA